MFVNVPVSFDEVGKVIRGRAPWVGPSRPDRKRAALVLLPGQRLKMTWVVFGVLKFPSGIRSGDPVSWLEPSGRTARRPLPCSPPGHLHPGRAREAGRVVAESVVCSL